MTKLHRDLFVLSCVLSLSACSGAVDIGGDEEPKEEPEGDGDEADSKTREECLENEAANPREPEPWPFDEPVVNEHHVGVFVGYAQHAADVTLELDADGGGSLIYGDTSVRPSSEPSEFTHRDGPGLVLEPIEGFPYTVHDLRTTEGRVRFALDVNEPFRDWCSARTPEFDSQACWGCSVPSDIAPEYPSGSCQDEASCIEVAACFQSCRCTSAGCEPTVWSTEFDGEVVGDDLRGTFGDPALVGLDGEIILTKE